MAERALVIGASGLVGGQLLPGLAEAGIEAVGTYRTQESTGLQHLDLADEPGIRALLHQLRPNIVYLPAALTNVDYCELHPEASYAVNVLGVAAVAQAATAIGARLVYLSTDYVFDGLAGPYAEHTPASPICAYGRQKLIAEHYIALHDPMALIIRTTVVYGDEQQGKNFVYRLLATLREGRELRVPTDQIGSPTYAPDLARATIDLAVAGARGLYHVAGPDLADRYQFALTAAEVFGMPTELIRPATTAELGQVAPRPLKAGLVVARAEAALGRRLVGYREGLQHLAAKLAQ